MPLIEYITQAGDPIQAGEAQLIPFSTSLRIRLPFLPAGWIWNRPTAVVVKTGNGGDHLIPIIDTTRRAQIVLLLVGIIGALLVWIGFRTIHRSKTA
jgi:hypothetical protein